MKTIILINTSQGPYLFSCQLELLQLWFPRSSGSDNGVRQKLGATNYSGCVASEKGSLAVLEVGRAAGNPQQILSSPDRRML